MTKKTIQIVGLAMAGLMAWFTPLQTTHGTNSCCAECVLKKEDEIDRIRKNPLRDDHERFMP